MQQLWLIRHGETEWSLSGAHTGRTDIPLTAEGERQAAALGAHLYGHEFALVLCSPLARARDTCRIAGYGGVMQTDADLREWDYGDYEGRKTPDIRSERPDWSLWRDGNPGGETIEDVAVRARRVIARALPVNGKVALFAHGHLLRILTACWLGLPPADGRLFALGTASVSILGYERETCVMTQWNLLAGTSAVP
jgi:broad specificity phosphatase PhoE